MQASTLFVDRHSRREARVSGDSITNDRSLDVGLRGESEAQLWRLFSLWNVDLGSDRSERKDKLISSSILSRKDHKEMIWLIIDYPLIPTHQARIIFETLVDKMTFDGILQSRNITIPPAPVPSPVSSTTTNTTVPKSSIKFVITPPLLLEVHFHSSQWISLCECCHSLLTSKTPRFHQNWNQSNLHYPSKRYSNAQISVLRQY